MKQEIVFEKPPIFDELVKVFPEAAEKGVIFSWGNLIYNPSGGAIPPWLLDHEAVHGTRQTDPYWNDGTIEDWWKYYIKDAQFRLDEELPAHQKEYKSYCEHVKDREQRARYLHRMAMRLAGPLYGRLITFTRARDLIRFGR